MVAPPDPSVDEIINAKNAGKRALGIAILLIFIALVVCWYWLSTAGTCDLDSFKETGGLGCRFVWDYAIVAAGVSSFLFSLGGTIIFTQLVPYLAKANLKLSFLKMDTPVGVTGGIIPFAGMLGFFGFIFYLADIHNHSDKKIKDLQLTTEKKKDDALDDAKIVNQALSAILAEKEIRLVLQMECARLNHSIVWQKEEGYPRYTSFVSEPSNVEPELAKIPDIKISSGGDTKLELSLPLQDDSRQTADVFKADAKLEDGLVVIDFKFDNLSFNDACEKYHASLQQNSVSPEGKTQ